MASRLIDESKSIKVTHEPQLNLDSSFFKYVPGNDNESGKQFVEFEYSAYLNNGELIKCVLNDPHFTMINSAVGPADSSYYKISRQQAPLNIKTRLRWASAQSDLDMPYNNHALAGIAPYSGEGNNQLVEFIGIDYASWFLNGGDAGGYRYKGSVKQVVEQIVEKYGRSVLQAEFKTKTIDSEENQWWQCRLTPKEFVKSLFEWTISLNSKKTKWLIYPDDEDGPAKVVFVEQGDMDSKLRATYRYRGLGSGAGGIGDILDWELIGNNCLNMINHKLVTSGISSISGDYFDKLTPDDGKKVIIGDSETSNKLKPRTNVKNAFTKPGDDFKPKDKSVGYTSVMSIPEFSAGELGIKYSDYIDGRARNFYLNSINKLMQARFRVNGHHIWSGSVGLGVDTINVEMTTAKAEPHFLQGNWIVMGYKHKMTREIWYTDLFCMRLDHDASAKEV